MEEVHYVQYEAPADGSTDPGQFATYQTADGQQVHIQYVTPDGQAQVGK